MLGVCCFSELLELEHPYKTFCCIFLPGIGELEIFVKIVKTVEEIPKFSAQQSQHVTISNDFWDNVLYHAKDNFLPILCSKFYKEKSHPFEELIRVTSEGGEGFLGNLAEELLRVHLDTIVTTTLAPWGHHRPSPGGWRRWASRCWPAS